jgi:hypothetical protein
LRLITDGDYNLRVVTTAPGEGAASVSDPIKLRVDTYSPTGGRDFWLAPNQDFAENNTGIGQHDLTTNNTQPTFRVTLPPDAEAGNRVIINRDTTTPTSRIQVNYELTQADVDRGYADATALADVVSGRFRYYLQDQAENTQYQTYFDLTIDSAPTGDPNARISPTLASRDRSDDGGANSVTNRNTGLLFEAKNRSYNPPTGTYRLELMIRKEGESDFESLGFTHRPDRRYHFEYNGDPLPDGTHEIAIRTHDAAGNISVLSPINDLVIDTTAPASSEITVGLDASKGHRRSG